MSKMSIESNMTQEEKIEPTITLTIIATGDGIGKSHTLTQLKKLLTNNGFKVKAGDTEHTLTATQNTYQISRGPIPQFIRAHIRPDPEGLITKEKLYKTYYKWCLKIGYTPLTRTAFSRAFIYHATLIIPNLTTTRRNIDGKRMRCWAGIIDKTDY